MRHVQLSQAWKSFPVNLIAISPAGFQVTSPSKGACCSVLVESDPGRCCATFRYFVAGNSQIVDCGARNLTAHFTGQKKNPKTPKLPYFKKWQEKWNSRLWFWGCSDFKLRWLNQLAATPKITENLTTFCCRGKEKRQTCNSCRGSLSLSSIGDLHLTLGVLCTSYCVYSIYIFRHRVKRVPKQIPCIYHHTWRNKADPDSDGVSQTSHDSHPFVFYTFY